ncbi:MAG: hypothetical protein RMJ81_04730 [Candidatus Kryptonium sp.]|nr:hypothetical protein [Candidatus Kryptonium sp.]MCX7762204.1 hypothetical protein [Candidatus Kryptonium sp.]MDW8108946.1 hypothetical protein [Candidatus Kryptonium sp.]
MTKKLISPSIVYYAHTFSFRPENHSQTDHFVLLLNITTKTTSSL